MHIQVIVRQLKYKREKRDKARESERRDAQCCCRFPLIVSIECRSISGSYIFNGFDKGSSSTGHG